MAELSGGFFKQSRRGNECICHLKGTHGNSAEPVKQWLIIPVSALSFNLQWGKKPPASEESVYVTQLKGQTLSSMTLLCVSHCEIHYCLLIFYYPNTCEGMLALYSSFVCSPRNACDGWRYRLMHSKQPKRYIYISFLISTCELFPINTAHIKNPSAFSN